MFIYIFWLLASISIWPISSHHVSNIAIFFPFGFSSLFRVMKTTISEEKLLNTFHEASYAVNVGVVDYALLHACGFAKSWRQKEVFGGVEPVLTFRISFSKHFQLFCFLPICFRHG